MTGKTVIEKSYSQRQLIVHTFFSDQSADILKDSFLTTTHVSYTNKLNDDYKFKIYVIKHVNPLSLLYTTFCDAGFFVRIMWKMDPAFPNNLKASSIYDAENIRNDITLGRFRAWNTVTDFTKSLTALLRLPETFSDGVKFVGTASNIKQLLLMKDQFHDSKIKYYLFSFTEDSTKTLSFAKFEMFRPCMRTELDNRVNERKDGYVTGKEETTLCQRNTHFVASKQEGAQKYSICHFER